MKLHLIVGVSVSLLATMHCSLAEDTNSPSIIPATQAKESIGSTVVVTGKVAEVSIAEKVVRLNFDHKFPKQTFTAIIFAERTNRFSDLAKLEGKSVEVRGKIREYRNRPEIVLTSTNQLRVLQP